MTASRSPLPGFSCSICSEPSTQICTWCTKDACNNHLCPHCLRCSDCCDCELGLDPEPQTAPPPIS
jgi:hypothetical protein